MRRILDRRFMPGSHDNWRKWVIGLNGRPKGGNWPECRSGCWMSFRDALSRWNERPRSWASRPPKERTDWPRSPANANRNSSPKWICGNYGTSESRPMNDWRYGTAFVLRLLTRKEFPK